MTELYVREYIQVAHRLVELPGKCQQIHGHSMFITVNFDVHVVDGYAQDKFGQVLDFSAIKKNFREHLSAEYDHHLLLNVGDPWAQSIYFVDENHPKQHSYLPGLIKVPGDPTVENIAKWIFNYMSFNLDYPVLFVDVQETESNGVTYYG